MGFGESFTSTVDPVTGLRGCQHFLDNLLLLNLSKNTLGPGAEQTPVAGDRDELETLLYPPVCSLRAESEDTRRNLCFLCGGEHLLNRFFNLRVRRLSQKPHRGRQIIWANEDNVNSRNGENRVDAEVRIRGRNDDSGQPWIP